jgi:glycosyltransferase involved in cell wall biosynthesis
MTPLDRPLRVLHVQRAAGIAGSERHLAMLLPALADAGVDVRMLVAETRDGATFTRELRDRGVDVRGVPAGGHVSPPLVRRVRSEIRDFRPDLVHTHLVHADVHGLLAARRCGVPAVSSVHGTPAKLRREPLHAAAAAIGRIPAVTIAISRYVASFLRNERLRPADRIRVVHYGIDAEPWVASPDERRQLRARLRVAPDEVVVAATSRLIPGKGHADLIDAFGHARSAHPRMRLLIAGDGPERDALESRAAGTDGVEFLGFQDDVRAIVQAADVLAFPTAPELGEGFGLTALEAMAAGRPVVATRVGAIPEVVAHDATGWLVDPHDIPSLSEALVRLAGDPDRRAAQGARGARRAREQFSIDALVEGTVAVYEEHAHA